MDKTARFAFRRLVFQLRRCGALTDEAIADRRLDLDIQAGVLERKGDAAAAKELAYLSSNLDQDIQTGT
jgi:hypothetical protein